MKFRGLGRSKAVKSVACVAVAAGFFGAFPSVRPAMASAPIVAPTEASAYEGLWVIGADADATAERGGRLDFEEFFLFESGVLTPQELSKLGFEPTAATFSTAADGTTSWTVTMTSNSQGTLTITGALSGTKMNGTILWDRNGETFKYAYSGTQTTSGAAAP